MRTVLHLAIDQYSEQGQLIGSHLAMRASSVLVGAHETFSAITAALPAEWRQVTYDEAVQALANRPAFEDEPWQQLSIF